jgi:hypothetical protein
MKYFFKDKKQYYNPINKKYELCCFELETIDIKQYEFWTNGLPKHIENLYAFINLEETTTQNINAIFLCTLQHESGLYLGFNFILDKKPFIWHYNPQYKQLFIPYYHHSLYYMPFTNETNTYQDFYMLNKYYIHDLKNDIYNHDKYIINVRTILKELDQIHKITHIYQKCNGNILFQQHGNLNLWIDRIQSIRYFTINNENNYDTVFNYQNHNNFDFIYDGCIVICGSHNIHSKSQFLGTRKPKVNRKNCQRLFSF